MGNQRFISRYNVLPVFNCLQDQLFGDSRTTDDFHQYIYFGIIRDFKDISSDGEIGCITIRIIAACTNLDDRNITTGAGINMRFIARENIYCTAAYGTQTADANSYRIQGGFLAKIEVKLRQYEKRRPPYSWWPSVSIKTDLPLEHGKNWWFD